MKKYKKTKKITKKRGSASSIKIYKGGNKKNVALIFHGRVNSYEFSMEYLNSIFRNPKFNCKAFVSLNLEKTNDYIKEFCNIFEIGTEQLNIEATVLPQSYIDMNKELCGEGACYFSYSMFYHQNKAFDLLEQYKNKHNINFDIVIVLRADLNRSNNAPNIFLINDNIKTNTVYIPHKNDLDKPINSKVNTSSNYYSDGITTLLAYGDFDTMKKYCSLIKNLTSVTHAEIMLLNHIKNMNIHIERYTDELRVNPSRRNSKYAIK